MNVEERLKKIILSKYKSVRAFAIENNIPYSTINNIFERGVGNMGISTAMKICNILNIEVDGLANGKIVERNHNNSNVVKINDLVLTAEERTFIKKLRSYDDRQKRKVYELVDDIDLYIQTQQKLEEMTKELKFYKENYVTEAKMIAFGGERESVKITPEKRKRLQEILNREEDGDDIIQD